MTPREQFIVSNAIGRNHRIVRTRPRSDVSKEELALRAFGFSPSMEDCPIEWAGVMPSSDDGLQFYFSCPHHEWHEIPESVFMDSNIWLEKTSDSETRTLVYVGQCALCLTIFYAIREIKS